MFLHVLCYLFFIAIVNAQVDSRDERLIAIFGNSSDFIPPGYEAVPKAPLGSLTALPKCGEGPDKGKKVCIVYHRCDATTNTVTPEEVINTTGEGLFDIRENANECEHYMDVCCKLPDDLPMTTTTTVRPIDLTGPPPLPPEPSFCGIRNEAGLDFKIRGNTNEAEHGEFPWMIVILKNSFNQETEETPFICGGALIGPNVVLTAAHCVDSYQDQLGQIRVRAGEWDALSEKERIPYQERAIKRIIVHKDYGGKKTLVNNIALLVLELPFTKAENIATLCLPENDQVFLAKDCIGSGWGKKEFGDKAAYSAILKKLTLPMVPRDQCQTKLRKTRLGKHFVLDQSFLCAGGEAGVDTCKGDGGSPLICRDPLNSKRYMQVGIVAWGIGCGEEDVPGVYVNVPRYRNWIDQQISNLGLSNKPYTM